MPVDFTRRRPNDVTPFYVYDLMFRCNNTFACSGDEHLIVSVGMEFVACSVRKVNIVDTQI